MKVPNGVTLSPELTDMLADFMEPTECREMIMEMADAFDASGRECAAAAKSLRVVAGDLSDLEQGREVCFNVELLTTMTVQRATVMLLMMHLNVFTHQPKAFDTMQEQLEAILPVMHPRLSAMTQVVVQETQTLELEDSVYNLLAFFLGGVNGK
jgi:hypothetical protein